LSLPAVELELEPVLLLVLALELEELSLVPSTPDADVDDGIAKTSKASTAFLIEPPSVSGGSLSSISLSVIVESDESDNSSASCFLPSSASDFPRSMWTSNPFLFSSTKTT
jgi:hypothetical protein